MEVDTGATVTVIPTGVYRSALSHVQVSLSSVRLQTYSGESLEVRRKADVPVRCGNQFAVLKIVVVDVSNKPAILERSWLQVIHMDWSSLFQVQGEKRLSLVDRLPALFGPGVGTLEGSQVRITLKEEAQPKFYRLRPVRYVLPEKVDSELSRLQNEGILRPVESSQWAVPIVGVQKADGTVWRLQGDTINPYLESNPYPMPNPEDIFATLAGGAIFSRLDIKHAYQQLQVELDSQEYRTVNTSKGLFAYTQMPFEISTAPSIWQREMDRILEGVAGTVCYMDDILVLGENESQHGERLMAVLQKLDKACLKLKREKCELNKSQVEYLDHVISSRGIQPSESKVEAIRDAPPPTNVTELKAFLGLLSYYRKFPPNLSSVLEPLYELLQKQRQ